MLSEIDLIFGEEDCSEKRMYDNIASMKVCGHSIDGKAIVIDSVVGDGKYLLSRIDPLNQ